MRIDSIKIGERHRKDLGDLTSLACSMDEIGLLHPVVVTPDGILIAGARRIAAAQMLGWTEIPERVVNLDDIVRGERAENVLRKDFTPSEAVAIAEALEPLERKAAKERMLAGQPSVNFTEGKGQALDKVASVVGMSRPTLTRAREIVQAAEGNPELFGSIVEKMDETGNVDNAYKKYRKKKIEQQRQELADTANGIAANDRWHVETADVATYQATEQFDFIITDPPYPRKYLELYSVLAQRAVEWLKPTGLLFAMCGQSYLDAIMARMCEHLEYYWTGCYLTPGQPTPLRNRQVNTTWKPILIFGLHGQKYSGKIFGDVWASEANDKSHHKWGQSASGMLAMIQTVCLPGQSIFDPFCGAGTTGVAALKHGCLFTGIDIEVQNANISRARLAEVYNDTKTTG